MITVKSMIGFAEQLFDEVAGLYVIIDNYKIKIPPTDLAMFQTLGPTIRQLKETVDIAMDTKEENITKFSTELEKAMNELISQVVEIRNLAQDPMVLNPNSDSEIVIQFMEGLKTKLEMAEELKSRYEKWGILFKNGGVVKEGEEKDESQPTESTDTAASNDHTAPFEESKAEIELKRTLWVGLRDWHKLTA
jgi:dynein heavy chain, axonemal